MKNKGFLSRSRIGDTIGHKETEATPVSSLETRTPASPPAAEIHVDISPPKPSEAMPCKAVMTGTRRYTILLRVPDQSAAVLVRHLEQVPPAARSSARRALVSAFIRSFQERPDARPGVTPTAMSAIRIDIRLSEAKLAGLLASGAAGPFEPTATALARLLSPRFAAFLDQL
jgi:hypothetical protein